MSVMTPVLLSRPRSWSWVRSLRALPEMARVAVAAVVALLLGGLTSFAQTVLPGWIEPIANSSSGWTLAVVLVVALVRTRAAWSALAGPLFFVALTLGYQLVSTMRGYPTSETFFLIAGVVVGPFIGVAAVWLRERGWRPALAAALLGGIGIGEGVYGLTVVAASISPVYPSLSVLGGALLVAVVCIRRTSLWSHRVVALAGAAAVAAVFLLAYSGASLLSGL